MQAGLLLTLAILVAACSPRAEAPASASTTTSSRTAVPTSATTTSMDFAGEPSQSPEDATRDGVLPIIAAAPNELRIDRQLELGDSGWSWVVSRLTEEFLDLTEDEGCRIGQLNHIVPPRL